MITETKNLIEVFKDKIKEISLGVERKDKELEN